MAEGEVPWFPGRSGPLPAALFWLDDSEVGHLHFLGPKGDYGTIPVTEGPTRDDGWPGPVWHIDLDGDEATVTPSIHFKGEWHSPYTTHWRIIGRDRSLSVPRTIQLLREAMG